MLLLIIELFTLTLPQIFPDVLNRLGGDDVVEAADVSQSEAVGHGHGGVVSAEVEV